MILTSVFLNLIICTMLLIYQWKQNKVIIYLVSLILMANIRQILMLLLNEPQESRILATLLVHFDPILILIGPILLLYYQSLIQGKLVMAKWFWLYLLPVGLFFINTLPYYLVDFETKVQFANEMKQNRMAEFKIPGGTWLFDYNIQMKLTPIHNWSYIAYCFIYLYQQKKQNLIKSKVARIIERTKWLIFFIVLPMILQIIFATLHAENSFDLSFQDSTISSDFMYLSTLILPLSFFLFPSWLYGSSSTMSIWEKISEMWSAVSRIAKEEKVDQAEKSADLDRIVQFIEVKKPYLKSNFSVHDVSRELNIPHLRVSHCFNKQLETTFPEYRNHLRIAHAVSLFKDNVHFQMSIEGIANQCGFKNKSSFYAAFRAVHQMTPTEWISKNL